MKQLTVYLNRNLVGTLSQDANGLLGFRYAPRMAAKSSRHTHIADLATA